MRVTTPRLTIHAEAAGQGEPLVLLHSLAMDGRIWQPLMDRLGTRFRCWSLDARGHGRTSWDGQPFTVTDLADDLLAAVDALELERPHVLGLSMGGSTALTFAGRYPDRVDGLVLADTTAWYGPDAPAQWEQRAEAASTRPRADLLGFQLERWFTGDFRGRDPGEVDRISGIFLGCDARAHAAACRALGGMDSRPLLPAIRARTMVLAGEEDYATPPAMARAIAAAVPGAGLRLVPGARHMSLIEMPGLADDIAAHLTAGPVTAP
jgi:3-oxoadipate enol-lactonase